MPQVRRSALDSREAARAEETAAFTGALQTLGGANTGLGLEVARQLARKNANLVLACRDLSKCDDAAASIHQFGRPRPRTIQLDLGDLKSVAKAASQLQKQI